MEISNTEIRFLWKLIRRALGFLCCFGHDTEIQLSVEETAPSVGQSSVQPWNYSADYREILRSFPMDEQVLDLR